MEAEAIVVLMVVGTGFLAVLLAAGLIVLVGVFMAAVLGQRSMGYRGWRGKLRYAVQHVFG